MIPYPGEEEFPEGIEVFTSADCMRFEQVEVGTPIGEA